MDEREIRKAEALQLMANVELTPMLTQEAPPTGGYTKISLSKLASLGVAFEPLANAIQTVLRGGEAGSGLYYVTVPQGMHLAEFRERTGHLGTVLDANNRLSGQAVLNPLICDPTMLFMAAALAGIHNKLDQIQESQREMMDFLAQKERSDLAGDLKVLNDILAHYSFNWNNEKYKTGNHMKALDIRQGAERKIDFSREQIKKYLNKKNPIHSAQSARKQLEQVAEAFQNYHMALYIQGFSTFLEVMLQENFDGGYLSALSQKLNDYSNQYRELYTESYDRIEHYLNSSVESRIFRGVASASKTTGEWIAKVPGIRRSPIDEALIGTGEKMETMGERQSFRTMGRLVEKQHSYVRPFIDSIDAVNQLYNQPLTMLFDQETLYLGSSEQV